MRGGQVSLDTFLCLLLGTATSIPCGWFFIRIADHISGQNKLWGK